MGANILPTCTAREIRGRIQIRGVWCIPIFCMHCHKQHGYRNEPPDTVAGGNYVGYLCDLCAETCGAEVGLMLIPDQVIADMAQHEMVETYGRVLTLTEQAEVLKDGSSSLAKLARHRVR